MDTRQLKTFIAIAEHGTFAKAAEAVGLTPSAVSQQMQALELEVNGELFDRSSRPITLNGHGLQMLEAARTLVRDADNIIDTIFRQSHQRDLHNRLRSLKCAFAPASLNRRPQGRLS